jgi:exodeoxyribonuclease VII large subunit
MHQIVFTVDKVNDYIKNILDAESMLADIQVRGEISNYGESGGNAYFILKGKTSQISCVYFAVELRQYLPKDGECCIVKGTVSYYKRGGKISFNVSDILPEGTGEAYIKFLQLKEKLEKQGIFDQEHKKPLPFFVSKLGVVTSKTGAVLHDIKSVAAKKYGGLDILLYSSAVQGKGSEFEIARGIEVLDGAGVDLIIVARGGGSAEDLMPFNTETVARAVYKCNTPIVSAVGHETDYTLCDLAADARAATPTAAAEITLPDAKQLAEFVGNRCQSISKAVRHKFDGGYEDLKAALSGITSNVNGKIKGYAYEIKLLLREISYKTQNNYAVCENLHSNMLSALDEKNPVKILKKGFSVVRGDKGETVSSATSLKEGQIVDIAMYDGEVKARVMEIAVSGKYNTIDAAAAAKENL